MSLLTDEGMEAQKASNLPTVTQLGGELLRFDASILIPESVSLTTVLHRVQTPARTCRAQRHFRRHRSTPDFAAEKTDLVRRWELSRGGARIQAGLFSPGLGVLSATS